MSRGRVGLGEFMDDLLVVGECLKVEEGRVQMIEEGSREGRGIRGLAVRMGLGVGSGVGSYFCLVRVICCRARRISRRG